jgi:hypothetical protein
MPVILKAQSSADLLAMLPSLVGFAPRESLVFLAFRGKRTCGAVRFDLPRSKSAAVKKRLVTSMIGMLCKIPGVDAMVPVIYTDAAFADAGGPPDGDVAEVVARRVRNAGFELRELLCQASDGWCSYLDSQPPAGGYPLSDIADSPVLAEIPEQLPEASVPSSEASVPDADWAVKERMGLELAALRATTTEPSSALEGAAGLIEEALEWTEADVDARAAQLLFVLETPILPWVAVVQWASTVTVGAALVGVVRELMETHREPDPSSPIMQTMSDIVSGAASRPDPERIEHGIALVRALVSRAEDAARPDLLCMLAWLSWALGHGSDASRYLAQCDQIEPIYDMAETLRDIFRAAPIPEWAFAVPSFDDEGRA